MKQSRPIQIGLFFVALGLTACGGPGTSLPGSPIAVATATPTPAPIPSVAAPAVSTPAPFVAVQTVSLPTAAPNSAATAVPLVLPTSASGVGGTITLPNASNAIPANTIVDESSSAQAPTGVPSLSASRSAQSRSIKADGQKVPLVFTQLTFGQTVTLASSPSFSFALPGTFPTTNVNYYIALYDPLRASLGWQYGFEGPGTASATAGGTAFTFPANPNPFTFTANVTYSFGLYAVAATASTPTPAPSTAPSAAPASPAPVLASPSSLRFTSVGANAAQSFAVSQASGSGSFKENDTCATLATVAISGSTVNVTPVAAGSCLIYVVGDAHAAARVEVNIALTNVGISIPSAAPSAAPSTSPSTAPSVAIAIAPNPVVVTGLSSGNAVTVTASEAGYSGAFISSVLDPSVAGVAPVPGGGYKVTGYKVGSTTLTLVDSNGHATTVPVTINPGINFIANQTYTAGTTYNLSPTEPNYTGTFTAVSSNTAVASIVSMTPANYVAIKAVTAGTATITVSDTAGLTKSFTVTVNPSNPIVPSPGTLAIGSQVFFTPFEPGYTGTFTVATDNASIATASIDSSNRVTVNGIAAGTAHITVTDTAGRFAVYTVTVH